jgi:hypothetical protein
MIRIDSDSADLRPILSPKCPQTMPPIGRTMNEIAKTPYAASRPDIASVFGKKTTAMMVAR